MTCCDVVRACAQDDDFEFYPGTGEHDILERNVVNIPLQPLWRSRSNGRRKPSTSSVSTTGGSGGGGGGGGGSGSSVIDRIRARSTSARVRAQQQQQHQQQQQRQQPSAGCGQNSSYGGDGSVGGGSSTSTAQATAALSRGQQQELLLQQQEQQQEQQAALHTKKKQKKLGRASFMARFRKRVIPALRAFSPDLILVSSGFDATKNDVGNAKHAPKFCCGCVVFPIEHVMTCTVCVSVVIVPPRIRRRRVVVFFGFVAFLFLFFHAQHLHATAVLNFHLCARTFACGGFVCLD